jgi:hypothetical protein
LRVPIVGKRRDDIDAMVPSKVDDSVELLKPIGAIVNRESPILDQLEPGAVHRNGINVCGDTVKYG